jgi:hypothetical protein
MVLLWLLDVLLAVAFVAGLIGGSPAGARGSAAPAS